MTTEASAATAGTARRLVSSIRVRIVVGYVLLLASALAIAVLVTRQVLLSRVERDVDRSLAQEIEELRRLATGVDPDTGEAFGTDVAAIFDTFLERNVPAPSEAFYTLVDGRPYRYSFNAPPELLEDAALVRSWASVTEPAHDTVATVAGEARTLAVPLGDSTRTLGTFVVAWFPAADRDDALQAVRIIAIAGAGVLLVTSAVAWSLAGRVLRPVRELTHTARQISESDLSARIPVVGDDELAVLGRTFNDMLDRLETGFTTQRRFLDDVAHELRTPITIARGHLEVLGDDPAERRESVEVAMDELDRMSRYVNDLLVLAKAEQPDFLRLGPVDLGELAETLLQRVPALGDRRWVLDAAPRPGLIAAVGDHGRLVQAVLNLASNAAQHTRPGDEIGIGVSLVDGNVRLWVRDTGPGVDPTVADRLFTRYARGVTSRIGRPDGMGLGLSIVDAIARAHAGHVTLESRPGQGATFTIVVPLDAGEAGDTDDESWPAPGVGPGERAPGDAPPVPSASSTSPRTHVEEHS